MPAPEASKAGIITDTSTGARHVPASQRADGSVRREIRVRPGYRPPEDVEVYKNRTAEAWKSRGQARGVPGAEFVGKGAGAGAGGGGGKAQSQQQGQAQAQGKSGKRKSKAKEPDSENVHVEDDGVNCGGAGHVTSNVPGEEDTPAAPASGADKEAETAATSAADPEAEKDKEARKLCKKLRQARELQQKKENGDSLLPEQFEKVIRMSELLRQLDVLGFDQDGKRKEG